MYGSEDPAVALPILLDHVRAGRLDLASLLGPFFPLDEVNEAVRGEPRGRRRPRARRALVGPKLAPPARASTARQALGERGDRLLLQPAEVAVQRERRCARVVGVEPSAKVASVTSSCVPSTSRRLSSAPSHASSCSSVERVGVRGRLHDFEGREPAVEQLVAHQAPVLVVALLVVRVRGREEARKARVRPLRAARGAAPEVRARSPAPVRGAGGGSGRHALR